MTHFEKILLRGEISFLQQHGIALSAVSDARGLGTDERRALMRRQGTLIAIGAPCKESGHRLRTSAGHCVMCDPKKIAFARRHRSPGQVYVARSVALTLIKVGSAKDAVGRIAQLNSETYGGGRDWQLVGVYDCPEAGKVESSVHSALAQFSAKGSYQKDGVLTDCYELFNCPAAVAMKTLQGILGLFMTEHPNLAAEPVPPQQPRTSHTDGWNKGDRVKHPSRPEWGTGTLIADGSNERVEVRFRNGGDRVLVPSLAKLIRIA